MHLHRILAIAAKEWRLNLRFPTEYLINNLVSPVKSMVLMCLLYSGFFRSSSIEYFGNVTQDNFIVYVLLGTVLHSQFSTSIAVFRGKMVTEKYWNTATATLLTPVSIFEVVGGFMIGSGGVAIVVNALILSFITLVYPIKLKLYLLSLLVLLLIAFLGFSLGLIGAMIGLCWEGKGFLFDYSVQAITFLSCFYYPIQLLPATVQKVVQFMPTYQLSNALHELYVSDGATNLPLVIAYMLVVCFCVLIPSGFLFESSVRKHGVIGY